MTWHMIRLDLARTSAFPQGSHEHCYLLRAPLDARHFVDVAQVQAAPERATVLRSSPDAPEVRGYLVRGANGWAFSYEPGDADDESLFHLDSHPLRVGDYVTVTDARGNERPFEVMQCEAVAD